MTEIEVERTRRISLLFIALAVFTCAAFAAAGGWMLWLRLIMLDFDEGPGYLSKLAAKSAGFFVICLCAYLAMRAFAVRATGIDGGRARVRAGGWPAAIAVTALIGAVLFARLDRYPWAAPDEMHHLLVARNFAQHGAYASGHESAGLTYFDIYDSVGPAAIVPVAWSQEGSPGAIVRARAVIAAFACAWTLLAFALIRPVLGTASAIAGIIAAHASFGTLYLGRSLYGEVPAFAYLFAGLLCWRRSIESSRAWPWGLAAGLLFGLSSLSKSFILIGGFAFLAVWLYDGLSHRQIRLPHVIGPAIGAVTVYSGWGYFQYVHYKNHAGAVPDPGSLIVYYRHYLNFGVGSVEHGLAWLIGQPIRTAGLVACFFAAVPVVLHRRYDPALLVLLLLIPLFAFWWLFYTTGAIHRYMWYSLTGAALFIGALASWVGGHLARRSPIGFVGAVLLGTFVATLGYGGVADFRRAIASDEMADDRALAGFVAEIPSPTPIATTYWPLERSLAYLTGRQIEVVDWDVRNESNAEVLILDAQTQPVRPSVLRDSRRFGRYVIVSEKF